MDKKLLQAITDIVDGKMVAIASSENPDRVGDSLKVDQWDFKNFKKNPVLQAGHDYRPQFTVGVAKNIRVEGKKVLFEPVFHTVTQLAREIKEMYEQGVLKAWSVGFIPAREEGQNHELLEISAVAVPANADALVIAKGMNEEEEVKVEKEVNKFIQKEISEGQSTEEVTEETPEEESTEEPVEEVTEEKVEVEEKTIETKEAEDTVEGELNEDEKRRKKYALITEIDKIMYAFYKVYIDSDTEVKEFSKLVKEVAGILIKVANGKAPESKVLKDFEENSEKFLEILDKKEGRVISKKNKKTINNAIDKTKEAVVALENLLGLEETPEETPLKTIKVIKVKSKKVGNDKDKGRKPKVAHKQTSTEELAVRALKMIVKSSQYALHEHNKNIKK